MLSPKGEFLKELEEGSLWFECLSLPWVIKISFSLPVGHIKKLDFIVRTGGRTGVRAYLVFVQYLLKISIFFSIFLLNLVHWRRGKISLWEKKSWRHVLLEKNQISILNFSFSPISFEDLNIFSIFCLILFTKERERCFARKKSWRDV